MYEQWRAIPSFPAYEASSFGRVRRVVATPRCPAGSMVPQRIVKGYPAVHLRVGGKQLHRYIHSLVCEAFNGPRPSLKHGVSHIDGVQTNNSPANLRWATQAENCADTVRHGRTARGERNPRAKLDSGQVQAIRLWRQNGVPAVVIAASYNVSKATISRVLSGRIWSHV